MAEMQPQQPQPSDAGTQTGNLPSDFDSLISAHDKPVLADFWADWCQPCHMMAPVLKDLARDWKGRLTIIKVNTEKKPQFANRFGITALPTLVLFKGGKEAHRMSGAAPLPYLKREFESFL